MIISKVLGHYCRDDEKYKYYTVDTLKLEQWESSKSRIKKKTTLGNELAISLERGQHLHNDDIIFIDNDKKYIVVIDVKLKNVLKISLSMNSDIETIFKLGHALGNQHWPAVLDNNAVYVPLYVDEKIMRSMLRTHNFSDIDVEFMNGDDLARFLPASDLRLLFSGDDTTAHKHH